MTRIVQAVLGLAAAMLATSAADANAYREKGKTVQIGESAVFVVPPRDWNRLDIRRGKQAETWTLDGEQLNDVTFYSGIGPGQALVRERSKKHDPLPKFSSTVLLAELPELLERTYRSDRKIGAFTLTGSKPARFLGRDGVLFTYDYTDVDNLPRKGEARAALVDGKLYLATFDAPRVHYFDRTIEDFRALADTAHLAP